MWPRGIMVVLVGLAMLSGVAARGQERARLEALLAASQELPLEAVELPVPLLAGQELGKVSWIAVDAKSGVTWLIQRGEKAEPVIAVDKKGTVLHSFGRGRYAIPHAIRLDPEGNVWTVDAGSSRVIKYSTTGEKLLEIEVGEMPKREMALRERRTLRSHPGAGSLSAMATGMRVCWSTRRMGRRDGSGGVRGRVRDNFTCRTRS